MHSKYILLVEDDEDHVALATRALREILQEARAEGLRYVEITTDPENVASQRVIESNGGVLVEEFVKPQALGGKRGLRYRVTLHDVG